MNTKHKSPPRRQKSEQKRCQILDAASLLFTQFGYDGVNMERVALEAQVSKQTVYSHFGCKDELFAEALALECHKHQISDTLLDTDEAAETFLPEFARRFSALLLSEGAISVYRLCVEGAIERPKLSEIFWQVGPERMCVRLSGYLQRQTELGYLLIPNTDIAARQFLYMLSAEAHFRTLLGLPSEEARAQTESYIEQCVSSFLRGYSN